MNRDDDIVKDSYTGNGFDRDQAATTNNLLRKSIVDMRDLKQITHELVKTELKTVRTVDKLITVITSLDQKNEKLQSRVYFLSIITGVLALAQLVVALVQIIK